MFSRTLYFPIWDEEGRREVTVGFTGILHQVTEYIQNIWQRSVKKSIWKGVTGCGKQRTYTVRKALFILTARLLLM
jgi:hypothetical protein